jgi:hypothetical protein
VSRGAVAIFLLRTLALSALFAALIGAALVAGAPQDLPGFGFDREHANIGVAYAFVAAGIVATALPLVWRLAGARSDGLVAGLLAATMLGASASLAPWAVTAKTPQADEPHWLLTTQSLVLDHDVELTNDYAGERYLSFFPTRLPDEHAVDAGHGLYPIREIGLPLLAAIPFASGGRLGVVLFLCAVGAALVAQLYLLARDLRVAPRPAIAAAAVAGLTYPVITYTTQVYPELVAALGFVTAARLLRSRTALAIGLASAIAGMLPWLHLREATLGGGVLLAALVVAASARPRDIPLRVIAAVVPAAAGIAALAWADLAMFGDPRPGAATALFYASRPDVLTPSATPLVGALGLFFDRTFGLVTNAPLYLVAFAGLPLLVARVRDVPGTAIALLAGGALYIAAIASYAYWWADWSPPPRYGVPLAPLLVAGLALAFALISAGNARGIALGAMALAAAAASYALTLIGIVLPSLHYNWGAKEVQHEWQTSALGSFLERVTGTDPTAAFPSLWWIRPDTFDLAVRWAVVALFLVALGLFGLDAAPATVPAAERRRPRPWPAGRSSP